MSKANGWLQHELFDPADVRKQKQDDFDKQIPLLPVDPMQQKYSLDRIILSQREYEIMYMVLTGHSIYDIAQNIHLSISGIKFRLSCIYWKFNVKNRLELIKKSTTDSLQFYLEDSPIKQVFHNRLDFKLFEKDENEPPETC